MLYRGRGLAFLATSVNAATPEQACQKGCYLAAAKYGACQQKVLGKFYSSPFTFDHWRSLSRCRIEYVTTWDKLQAEASGTGSTCDAPRFVDNSDGTVLDNLTGLQWEKKTDDSSVHDLDNEYS